jgi:hypothetical protein
MAPLEYDGMPIFFLRTAMSAVVIDSALRAKLNGLNQELEFRDEAGNLIGYFLPPKRHEKLLYAWAKSQVSDEELEEARRDYQKNGGLTTDQVLAHLERVIREGKGA